jgi:hypothetical protein
MRFYERRKIVNEGHDFVIGKFTDGLGLNCLEIYHSRYFGPNRLEFTFQTILVKPSKIK